MAKNKLRALKIKLANLQLEIQSLIEKSERDPSLIDAITSDISEFTSEVTRMTKELSNINIYSNSNLTSPCQYISWPSSVLKYRA